MFMNNGNHNESSMQTGARSKYGFVSESYFDGSVNVRMQVHRQLMSLALRALGVGIVSFGDDGGGK